MHNKRLDQIRSNDTMTLRQQLQLTVSLSLPAIMAQLSSILMQYIDAAMVGHLGSQEAASIGLVSTSIWLFGGLCTAAVTGFSVQVSHAIGGADFGRARNILRQSLVAALCFCFLLVTIGISISSHLPHWLGGDPSICAGSTLYFTIFILSLPFWQLNYLGASMLRATGNIKLPSVLNVMCCVLDVIFNFVLIFPDTPLSFLGLRLVIPGAGLGLAGAALGSVLAHVVTATCMLYFLFVRSPELKLWHTHGSFRLKRATLRKATKISLPMMMEHAVMCSAQICITAIVAPLGITAIAANSFAVIAESLCYMPGYGIGDAATTLIGLSIGAGKPQLTRRFAYTTVGFGIAVMTFMGVIMYIFAPFMLAIMTPDTAISSLGASVLRIEAWAEPMFAASIVAYGVFVGAGDTFKPFLMNVGSMWVVRISLAALLASSLGLKGVWIAMCTELCVRGLIFLIRLHGKSWMRSLTSNTGQQFGNSAT